ncbi:MAG TPA: GNAT family N-acetyltransferase [Saprospiraceae bacterium]|nr:GNAT family N-acetyltransferase [Saprospiraceae bacterium]HPN69667.1 GNAT family N-acetyltransferase [Saprospiraceae bacterium]
MSEQISLKRVDSNDVDFQTLVGLLDKDLNERYEESMAFFSQFNHLSPSYKAIVAYLQDEPVGCGAIKYYDEEKHELKRMFVKQEARNHGLGFKIVAELVQWAKEMGVMTIILETGIKQPEAIHLYRKCGFSIIPNFDQYIGVEESVCMQKQL